MCTHLHLDLPHDPAQQPHAPRAPSHHRLHLGQDREQGLVLRVWISIFSVRNRISNVGIRIMTFFVRLIIRICNIGRRIWI